MNAPSHPDEAARLEALRQYDVLDTAPEEAFDDLTLLASHICQTPTAMVSLVDEKRQWFKSRIGMPATETPRDVAFVAHRILRAIDQPTIDHRGPTFQTMAKDVLERIRHVFRTEAPVVIYPASGTGAWEAALVNTLSPGDRVLMYETGHFATLWRELAARLEARLARLGVADEGCLYRIGSDGGPQPVTGRPTQLERMVPAADLLLNFDYRIDSELAGRFARRALVDIDPGLLQFWISVGQLGRATKLFRSEGCRDLIFIGTLLRPALSEIRLDWGTIRVLGRVFAAFRGGDDHLLSGIGRILEQDGFRMVGIRDIAPDILMPEGSIARATPDSAAALRKARLLEPKAGRRAVKYA